MADGHWWCEECEQEIPSTAINHDETHTYAWVGEVSYYHNVQWVEHVDNPPSQSTGEGWWCPMCQRSVEGEEVTFNEFHTECGHPVK